MSQKEYQNISGFINGTLTEEQREGVSKQFQNYTTNIE